MSLEDDSRSNFVVGENYLKYYRYFVLSGVTDDDK